MGVLSNLYMCCFWCNMLVVLLIFGINVYSLSIIARFFWVRRVIFLLKLCCCLRKLVFSLF